MQKTFSASAGPDASSRLFGRAPRLRKFTGDRPSRGSSVCISRREPGARPARWTRPSLPPMANSVSSPPSPPSPSVGFARRARAPPRRARCRSGARTASDRSVAGAAGGRRSPSRSSAGRDTHACASPRGVQDPRRARPVHGRRCHRRARAVVAEKLERTPALPADAARVPERDRAVHPARAPAEIRSIGRLELPPPAPPRARPMDCKGYSHGGACFLFFRVLRPSSSSPRILLFVSRPPRRACLRRPARAAPSLSRSPRRPAPASRLAPPAWRLLRSSRRVHEDDLPVLFEPAQPLVRVSERVLSKRRRAAERRARASLVTSRAARRRHRLSSTRLRRRVQRLALRGLTRPAAIRRALPRVSSARRARRAAAVSPSARSASSETSSRNEGPAEVARAPVDLRRSPPPTSRASL